MIRKISVQDIIAKHGTQSEREDNESIANDPRRHERDYLIERLTRKHAAPPVAEPTGKAAKHQSPRSKGPGSKIGKKWIWLGIPLILILFTFVVLQFMVSATVTVKPKQSTVQVDTKLTASVDATTSSSSLMYQIITLSAMDSETIIATSTVKTKPQKATGTITIFNGFSSAPQTLVKNTRFETPGGLIYRTPNAVNIPGMTVSGSKTVSGSVTITVVADQIGSKYNIGMVDFTIPGFSTDAARYAKIFARSKTAMTGGSDGNSFGVSDNARKATEEKIEVRLQSNLLRQVQSQKTANSVIFDTASKISFQRLPDTAGADTQHVVIHEQGTISSVAFDKNILGKLLLTPAIAAVGNNAELQGLDKLHFIAAVSSTSPIWQAKPFTFTLTGPVNVVGVVDANKLLQDILGIPRANLNKVLSNYPTVDKAIAKVNPFWKSSFPTDATKIKVEVVK